MPTHSTGARRTGLLLLGLVSLGDAAAIALTDGEHPPYPVAALVTVLGLVSLGLVVRALRDEDGPVRLLIVLRVLSALSAVPAFLVADVPAPAIAAAAVAVGLTALGIVLVAGGARRTVGATR